METAVAEHRQNLAAVHQRLTGLLDGMDYCLDWKPDAAAWSVRELVYHLLDTPAGGWPAVIAGTLSGNLSEYEIQSDLTNLTPERAAADLGQIAADIDAYFAQFNAALEPAADADLTAKTAMMRHLTRQQHEPRSVGQMLAGFDRHWQEHLQQLAELHDALGF